MADHNMGGDTFTMENSGLVGSTFMSESHNSGFNEGANDHLGVSMNNPIVPKRHALNILDGG